jgi:hypothetical protein
LKIQLLNCLSVPLIGSAQVAVAGKYQVEPNVSQLIREYLIFCTLPEKIWIWSGKVIIVR